MAGRIAPKVSTDGLILYLDAANTKSYVSGSTRWNDMSRRENNGTLVNGPTFNSANGGYIVLDGIDDYYQLGNFAFDTSTSFTISCWFKRNVLTNMNTKFLLKTLNDGAGRIWFGGIDTDNIYGRLENNTYYGAGNDYWQTVTTNLKNTNWYNVVMVHNKTSLQQKSYLNGVLAATKVLTGAYDNPSSPMRSTQVNSSVSNLLIYNRALTDGEILQNYNVLKSRYSFTTIGLDTDAQAFITAAGITDSTQQSAINTLVLDLKIYGIWTKMKAIYPMVGGTATTHKFNLKDPRDDNAAFRLSFIGGWLHTATGAKPNGTTGYADSFLVPNTHLTLNNTGISYYASTLKTASNGAIMGAGGATSNEISIFASYGGGTDYLANSSGEYTGSFLNSQRGLIQNTRISSTSFKVYLNGVVKYDLTSTSTSLANNSINIARCPTWPDLTDVECSFSAIDTGLTDTEAANFYTAVQKYQTTLNRQV